MLKTLILKSRENYSDDIGNEDNVDGDGDGDEGKIVKDNDKVEGDYEDCILPKRKRRMQSK